MSGPVRKIIFSIMLYLIILLFGSVGYVYFENKEFVDSVYMTIVTSQQLDIALDVPSWRDKRDDLFLWNVSLSSLLYG